MIRKKIFASLKDDNFRYRGHEIFRIEALSDAVFAFSVSILAMSLEVPQTFEELKLIINGAIPFFATVSVIFILWYRQHTFFRHYGLNDFTIILLNLVYLAIILFYVYPLKFLFSVLIGSWTGINLFPVAMEKGMMILSNEEFPHLIMLFSLGYMLIWSILTLMHKRVLILSKKLGLNRYEVYFTKQEMRGALLNSGIGFMSIIFAGLHLEMLAGVCYLFIPVILIINRWWFNKELRNVVLK